MGETVRLRKSLEHNIARKKHIQTTIEELHKDLRNASSIEEADKINSIIIDWYTQLHIIAEHIEDTQKHIENINLSS